LKQGIRQKMNEKYGKFGAKIREGFKPLGDKHWARATLIKFYSDFPSFL
jgi:hypothetical protein